MKKKNWALGVSYLLALACLSGCALLSKSAPITPRYFTPELEPSTQASEARETSGQRLRLGRVSAGPHLRERIAYRSSEQEVGYYNERRWTERPEAYLRRALSRSLFEEHGLIRAVSGAAPTLDAELVAFEEIQKPKHRVRVRAVISLDDTSVGYLEQTVSVERDVDGDEDDAEAVVRALSSALREAVAEISRLVIDKLAEIPAATPAPPSAGATTTTLSTTTTPAIER